MIGHLYRCIIFLTVALAASCVMASSQCQDLAKQNIRTLLINNSLAFDCFNIEQGFWLESSSSEEIKEYWSKMVECSLRFLREQLEIDQMFDVSPQMFEQAKKDAVDVLCFSALPK